jgi:hypothetical protein
VENAEGCCSGECHGVPLGTEQKRRQGNIFKEGKGFLSQKKKEKTQNTDGEKQKSVNDKKKESVFQLSAFGIPHFFFPFYLKVI